MNSSKLWITLILAGLAIIACNKGFDRLNEVKEYEDTTGVTTKTPKVMLLVVDGARGESVRDAKAPNLLAMQEHAIYSWHSISDTLSINTTTWADLLTGVHKEKHRVTKKDLSGNRLLEYPVFFSYIKQRNPSFRIGAYSSSDSLGNMLITGADVNETFADNDEAMVNALLDELKIDTAGVVFGQFSSVANAGKTYGYDNSHPEYKAAILKTDEYIGRILTALQQRTTYQQEDWLVVVTSGRGGPFQIDAGDDDGTILSNTNVNTFTFFYSPRYISNFIDRPYTGNRYAGKAVRLYGDNASNAVFATIEEGREDYNLSDTNEVTISLKLKKNRTEYGDYSYTYPSVMGNNMSMDWWNNTGWNISLEANGWGVHFGQNGKGFNMATATNIADGRWHDLTAVFLNRDNKRFLRLYTDGAYNREMDITQYGSFDTDAPLTLGFMPGNVTDNKRWLNAYITEVKFWRAALPDSVVANYVCSPELPSSHPYRDYLIGYWSCKDGFGGVFKDQSDSRHDFEIKGSYVWEDFSDLMCPTSATNLSQVVPQPVDVVRQIMNWLQIPADTKWGLDGKVWVTSYTGI